VALLLELLELARLELPRELRQAEQRQALQGVRGEACGWDLPLAKSFRLPVPRVIRAGAHERCSEMLPLRVAQSCLEFVEQRLSLPRRHQIALALVEIERFAGDAESLVDPAGL
jgi:hypothetical protein